jgi:ribosomal protein L37AE/L43A
MGFASRNPNRVNLCAVVCKRRKLNRSSQKPWRDGGCFAEFEEEIKQKLTKITKAAAANPPHPLDFY